MPDKYTAFESLSWQDKCPMHRVARHRSVSVSIWMEAQLPQIYTQFPRPDFMSSSDTQGAVS